MEYVYISILQKNNNTVLRDFVATLPLPLRDFVATLPLRDFVATLRDFVATLRYFVATLRYRYRYATLTEWAVLWAELSGQMF